MEPEPARPERGNASRRTATQSDRPPPADRRCVVATPGADRGDRRSGWRASATAWPARPWRESVRRPPSTPSGRSRGAGMRRS